MLGKARARARGIRVCGWVCLCMCVFIRGVNEFRKEARKKGNAHILWVNMK